MKRLVLLLCLATVAAAQEKVEILIDLEGVHRTGGSTEIAAPDGSIYAPEFDNGGGIGGGVNWYFSSRVSLELKVAALVSGGTIVVRGPDFIGTVELDDAQIYPITAVMQWHPFEKAALRPYFGAGVSHVILRNISQSALAPGLEFDNPTGLVLNGGVHLLTSKRWSLYGDVKYIPIETSAGVRLEDGGSGETSLDVKPLVVSFGIAYHF